MKSKLSFIFLWLGEEYLLGKGILVIILCNMFIMQTRGTVNQFLFAYKLFYDVWAPLTEAGLSIAVSLVCGSFWGLEGVLLGSVVSMFFIIVMWKPYLLYHKGFNQSIVLS